MMGSFKNYWETQNGLRKERYCPRKESNEKTFYIGNFLKILSLTLEKKG
jgi:hypothetical protein